MEDGWRTVEVVCRAEGRADERPLKFRIDRDWIPIDRVVAERLEAGVSAQAPVFRLFEVDTCQGRFALRVVVGGWRWQARRHA